MRTTRYRIGLIVGGLALALSGTGFGQDWPQWRGPNRDGKVTGFDAPATWPKSLTEKWKVPVGVGDSTPAVVGDKVYVFAQQDNDEVTLCLDAATGKTIWQEKYAPHTQLGGPAARHGTGPRSSPAVAQGKVVTMGFSGILSCLDAASGKLLWRKESGKDIPTGNPRFYAASSPVVVDGMCVAHVGATGKGALMAFDLTSGEKKWEWAGDPPAYSSPVLMTLDGKQVVVEEGEKFLSGVEAATGKELWKTPFAGQGMSYNAATPIVDGDTIICTGHGTSAYKVAKEGDAYAAKQVWTNAQLGTQFNTPVLKDGMLLGLSARRNVFCMDAATGKVLWTDPTARDQFGSIVEAGTVMMLLTPDGQLTVFKPSKEKFEEVAKYKVSDAQTFAHPVVSGNRIYIKDKDSLKLLAVDGRTAS